MNADIALVVSSYHSSNCSQGGYQFEMQIKADNLARESLADGGGILMGMHDRFDSIGRARVYGSIISISISPLRVSGHRYWKRVPLLWGCGRAVFRLGAFGSGVYSSSWVSQPGDYYVERGS